MNYIFESLFTPIIEVEDAINNVAKGDLTQTYKSDASIRKCAASVVFCKETGRT